MKAATRIVAVLMLGLACPALAESNDRPSRRPFKDCAGEKASDRTIGLEAWVLRCDYGCRKIDFLFEKGSLAMRYSDAGSTPEPVVDVFDLKPGESYEAGMRRLFAERT